MARTAGDRGLTEATSNEGAATCPKPNVEARITQISAGIGIYLMAALSKGLLLGDCVSLDHFVHSICLGRTQAVALSVSANLLEGARSLLISGVLIRFYVRDFYFVLLVLFGHRDEDEDGTDFCLSIRTSVLIVLFRVDRDLIFLSDFGVLRQRRKNRS
jgi:hypothetical protein